MQVLNISRQRTNVCHGHAKYEKLDTHYDVPGRDAVVSALRQKLRRHGTSLF